LKDLKHTAQQPSVRKSENNEYATNAVQRSVLKHISVLEILAQTFRHILLNMKFKMHLSGAE
jgi:hypothetical protein